MKRTMCEEHTGRNNGGYQYGNHLDSASLELSTTASIISYEEYFPYGDTSFIAGTNQKEVKLKEYRYTGKEKDDVTGLYYYGARYYASWLGRWMSADPLFRENPSVYDKPRGGSEDEQKKQEEEFRRKLYSEGLNLYGYVKGNPVVLKDPSGTESSMSYEEYKQLEGMKKSMKETIEDLAKNPPNKDGYYRESNGRVPEYISEKKTDYLFSADGTHYYWDKEKSQLFRDGQLVDHKKNEYYNNISHRFNEGIGESTLILEAIPAVQGLKGLKVLKGAGFLERQAVKGSVKGGVFKNFDDIVSNPKSLYGKSADEVKAILGEGWTQSSYGKTGTGWKFNQGDKMIFYHEGGRHVGPYYGFSSATTGKVKIIGPDYKPLPGDKAKIIDFFKD